MSYDVNKIADKMLSMAVEQHDPLTNMKLQKLLYYQQGFHIAMFDKPLFNEEIEAWMYGPVVPSVYERFSDRGYQVIEVDPLEDTLSFANEKEAALFAEVFRSYSAFSAYKLMDMTHSESPWKTTPTGKGCIITKDKLKSYFMTRLK